MKILHVLLISTLTRPLLASDPIPTPYPDHTTLHYFLTPSGEKRPIKTADDWTIRREHIATWMQTVMGPRPSPAQPVPLDVKIEEEIPVGDDLTRRKISYHTDSTERRVKAYLFVPTSARADRQTPAILCLHQTTPIGKSEPAGLGPKPNLHYGLHLAQRGYITLAPDYPSFGEYAYAFPPGDGYASGTMKAIYDNIRAVDVLQRMPEVDGMRLGCIGHSLGGHNAMFTAFFEPRLRCIVSNCGFTRFHKYYGGALKGWTSPRYMPLIASRYHNNPDEVPFDFPEIVAGFAPRPFLAVSPLHDANFEVSGVRDTMAAARPIYELFGASNALQAHYPDCAHDFPEASRKLAYDFLDQHLRGEQKK